MQARLLLAFGVMFGVGFRSLCSVMLGMYGMAMCCYCMMRRFFSSSSFVVLGRFAVM